MSYTPFFNYVPNSNYINHFSSYPPKFSDKLDDNLIININDYNKVKRLGGGAFGDVYLVENKNNHKIYAAKETKNNASYEIEDLKNEIKIYSEFNEPTILKIHGYSPVNFKNQPYPIMLLEYMKNGSLASNLSRCRKETEKEFRSQFKSKRYNILYGLTLALCYLHSKGIIHRDIKPENILLDDNFYPVVCDFGTVLIPSRKLLEKQKDDEVGTPCYLAPEIILKNERYTYKTDIYSFALVAYELLTGYEPFSNYKKIALLYNAIRKGERPKLTMVTDPEIQLFFQKCWSNEPNERPSAREILLIILKPQFRKVFGGDDIEFMKYMTFLSSNENYKHLFGNEFQQSINNFKYMHGVGVEQNLKKSLENIKNAASSGDANSIYNLALHYEILKDYEKSSYYCKIAADKGSIQAIVDMGDKYLRGIGVPVDFAKSCYYYKKAAKLNSPIGMFNYAVMLHKGRGVPVNLKKAAKYYEMSADLGNVNAMYSIARMHDVGEIYPPNYQKAAFYYKKAAAQGDTEAMWNLGLMESYGKIPKEYKAEDHYLKMSVKKGGDKEKIIYASSLCHDALYTEVDQKKKQKKIKKAASYFKEVADKGNVEAMVFYGRMIIAGLLSEDNVDEAIKYSKIAANDRTVEGMINCGLLLMIKSHKDPDCLKEALKYFQMAADCKDDRGAQLIMLLKTFMSVPRKRKIDKNFYEGFGSDLYELNKDGSDKNTKEQKVEDTTKLKNDSNSSIKSSNDRLDKEIFSDKNGESICNENHKYKKDANNDYNNNNINNNNYNNSSNNNNNDYNNSNNNYNNNNNNYNNSNNNYNNNNYSNNSIAFNNNNYINDNDNRNDNKCNNYQNNSSSNKKNINNNPQVANQKNEVGAKREKCQNNHNTKPNKSNKTDLIDDNNNTQKASITEQSIHNDNAINKVKVNICQSLEFETNDFICFSQSTIPVQVLVEIDEYLDLYPCFTEKKENICNPNDPNSFFTFYFYTKLNFDYNTIINGLKQIVERNQIIFYQPKFYVDIYFDETMFPKDDLKIFLKHLKIIPGVNSIQRNIFDGKQISTYLVVQDGYQRSIIESVKNLLISKNLIFNTVMYPLKSNIIINEEMVLQHKTDFDTIVKEIESISIKPVFVERNKLLLYGDYPMRKLFQNFSFICFQNEMLKMVALNHINALVYEGKENILEYDLDLYYVSINENSYPKRISNYIPKIFENLKGFKDIQRSVLSIESPVERTYVGFDSIKHLKKAYSKFKNRINVLLHFQNPKLFLKKKNNYQYFYINGNPSFPINFIINLLADKDCDIQEYCNEIDESSGKVCEFYRTYFGFKDFDDLTAGMCYIAENFNIKYYNIDMHFFKAGKGYINVTYDSQVSYLFYDNL